MSFFDRATRQYFDLLEGLGQAGIATDAEGRILYWSRAAETLYGWTRDEVLGRDVVDVVPSEISRAKGAQIMKSLRRGELWSGDFPVRGNDGRGFTASVTDVPLIGEGSDVVGVIGVSAPVRRPTDVGSLVTRLGRAAEPLWPGQIAVQNALSEPFTLSVSEPHLIQLLSLLLIRFAEALDGGALAGIAVGPAEESLFADFGLKPEEKAVYIRIGRRDERPRFSLLRDVIKFAAPTNYAAALVRMLNGSLLISGSPLNPDASHLILI